MINKNIYIIVGILILIVFGGIFVFAQVSKPVNSTSTSETSIQTQNVVLSVKNFNYYPQEVHVKVGQPVSISLDSSVTGCLRTFTIPSFGISKNLKTPSDSVDFTPTQKGTYKFACSMGMGYGTIVVE